MQRFIKKNYRYIIGYFIFCTGAFLLFFYLLFPVDALISRIIYEVEKGTSTEINITSDGWTFPLGLTFNGMRFIQKDTTGDHTLAYLDKLSIQIPVKSILSFSPVSLVTADIYGGSAKGLLTLRSANRIIKTDWNNIDISRIDKIKEIPAELTGKLNGNLVMRFNNNMPEGQIHLLLKDGKLAKIKVMGFVLPELPVEEMQGIINIKGNDVVIEDIRFKNNDIKGTIKGKIQFQPDKGSGDMDISIRFAVGDKIKKDYQGLLSLIERSKDREGYYTLKIKGDIKKPALSI